MEEVLDAGVWRCAWLSGQPAVDALMRLVMKAGGCAGAACDECWPDAAPGDAAVPGVGCAACAQAPRASTRPV